MMETNERADVEELMTGAFAFYGRVSTEDMQDPVASRLWQLDRARTILPPGAVIVTEYFDVDHSRSLPWARRPEASRLLSALADPSRGFSGVAIGEPARAFHGNQYGLTFPLFVHYGVELWVPEVGGRIDPDSDAHDLMMQLYGGMSKGERNRIRTRVRSSMASQTLHQGRFLGGRPPYGYRLDAIGPHPNPRKAAEGASLHQLVPDAETAPVVRRIFEEYAAGLGFAAIAQGLNEFGIPSPAAHDPLRNSHRDGTRWRDSAVRAILANPRYSGYQAWGRAPRSEVYWTPATSRPESRRSSAGHPKNAGTDRKTPATKPWYQSTSLRPCKPVLRRAGPAARCERPGPPTVPIPCEGWLAARSAVDAFKAKRAGDAATTAAPPAAMLAHTATDTPCRYICREDMVVPPLDKWLAEALSEEAADRSAQELSTKRRSAETEAREKSARRALADADRKIARLEQALQDGLPTSTFARLARKHEIARDAAKAELSRIKNAQPEGLTPEEFKAALQHARSLAAALAGATDAQRQQLYEALGLDIQYDPADRMIHTSITPLRDVGVNRGVGGGT